MILSRAPLSRRSDCVRLACIRHAASVHPEPGSNSSLCGWKRRCRSSSRPPRNRTCKAHHHDSVVKVPWSEATKNQMAGCSLHLATDPRYAGKPSRNVSRSIHLSHLLRSGVRCSQHAGSIPRDRHSVKFRSYLSQLFCLRITT